MQRLIVIAKKLNKRKWIPAMLPDLNGIIGTVNEGFTFLGEEISVLPNPSLGKWYKDQDQKFYWGGGLNVLEDIPDEEEESNDHELEHGVTITPKRKRKN